MDTPRLKDIANHANTITSLWSLIHSYAYARTCGPLMRIVAQCRRRDRELGRALRRRCFIRSQTVLATGLRWTNMMERPAFRSQIDQCFLHAPARITFGSTVRLAKPIQLHDHLLVPNGNSCEKPAYTI